MYKGRALLLLSALAGATLAAGAVAPRGDAGARVHIAVDASGDAAPPAAAGRRPLMRKAGHGRDTAAAAPPAGADDQPRGAGPGPGRAGAGETPGAGGVAVGSLAADVSQSSRRRHRWRRWGGRRRAASGRRRAPTPAPTPEQAGSCGYSQIATSVSAVASTDSHACTIHRSSSTLCCLGGTGAGETKVPEDLGPVQAVAAGGGHTCAISQSDRSLRCWGRSGEGQTKVPEDLGRVEAVAAGTYHTCAIAQSDRSVRCWGSGHGQTKVPGDLGRAVAVVAGERHTCAIAQSDRSLWCWGGGAVPLVLSVEKQKYEVGIEKKAAENAREQARKEKDQAETAREQAVKREERVQKEKEVVEKEKEAAKKEKEKVQKEKELVEKEKEAAEKEKEKVQKEKEVVEKEKEAAEKARLAAQQKTDQAEKQERQAKKEREEARRGKAIAVIEKSCSAELTRQVEVEISCAGAADNVSYAVPVPDGVMLFGSPFVQAHRCTNRGACIAAGAQGRRWQGSEIGAATCPLGANSSNLSSPMCGTGYDDQSPGCSRCSEGYGRASTDAFVCQACGMAALQLAGYMMIPLAIYTISVRGALARARTRSGIFNDLLKIFLSFGQGATVVMSAVVTSDSYQALPELPQKFLSSGDSSVESAALYSGSLDCLTNSTVGIDRFLLLVLLPPATIVLASFLLIAVQQALRASHRPAKFYVILVSLVAGNQFLAQIVGASFRTLPCAHTQKAEGAESRQFLTYEIDIDCKDRPASYLFVTIGTCALSLICGPILWSKVLQEEGEKGKTRTKDPAGEEGEEYAEGGQGQGHHVGDGAAGFLTGNYRDGCRAWEALVLIRKIALAVASTMAPMSYSPGLHIILALGILMLSLAAHLYAKPFRKEKNMLNNVEGASLVVLNVALLLAMYITTDIWSATTASKQVATVLAGTLLILWFWVLIALMIWAKLAEMRKRSPDEELADEGAPAPQRASASACGRQEAPQDGAAAAAATPAAQDEGGITTDEPGSLLSPGRSVTEIPADDRVAR